MPIPREGELCSDSTFWTCHQALDRTGYVPDIAAVLSNTGNEQQQQSSLKQMVDIYPT